MSTPTGPRPPTPPPAAPTAPPAASPGPARLRFPSRRWLVVALIAAGALIVTTVVLAVLSTTERDGGRSAADRSVSGARNGRQEAGFDVVSGANSVTVRSADLGEDMYRVSTPENGNLLPQVADGGAEITLTLVASGEAGPATVEVLLHSGVRWRLRLAGGGTDEIVDFRSGRLAGVELVGGASRIDLALPAPEGTLPVRLTAGAGTLSVNLRPGPLVQVSLNNGAGTLSVDDATQTGLAAGTTVTPPGWQEATDRYDIEAVGGVSALIVHRH